MGLIMERVERIQSELEQVMADLKKIDGKPTTEKEEAGV